MNNATGSETLRALFQLIEKEKQDKKLSELLSAQTKSLALNYEGDRNAINLLFNNGITITIFFNDLDGFKIIISDNKLYQNEDTDMSKISNDRICFYLKILAEHIYVI